MAREQLPALRRDIDAYASDRLDIEIKRQRRAAEQGEARARTWTNAQILGAVATPLLIAWAEIATENQGVLRGLALLSSGVVVVATGFVSTRRFAEEAAEHRRRERVLSREKWFWQQKAGPYGVAEDPDGLLIQRIEALLNGELPPEPAAPAGPSPAPEASPARTAKANTKADAKARKTGKAKG